MVPDELELDVGKHSDHCHDDESEEHFAHGEYGGLVNDVFLGALVNELQHLDGLHLSVAAGDGPLELLQVKSLLHFTHHCHMGLGDYDVGGSVEAELFEDFLTVGRVRDAGEEGGIVLRVDCPVVFVKVHHVLELWVELTACMDRYVQSLQLLAVK